MIAGIQIGVGIVIGICALIAAPFVLSLALGWIAQAVTKAAATEFRGLKGAAVLLGVAMAFSGLIAVYTRYPH